MASNLMSPLLFQSVPFGSETAWLDFLRTHDIHHLELAKVTGTPFVLMDDLKENLRPHALLHQAIAKELGISPVGDLESFDLADETSFISWSFLNSQDHQRMMVAAGL